MAARGGKKSTDILLTRVRTAPVPEVVQVGDLLHAEPAEFAAAHGTGHVITAPIVHFDDVGAAARARLDVISWGQTEAFTHLNTKHLVHDFQLFGKKNVKRLIFWGALKTFCSVLITAKSCLKVTTCCEGQG